ncbi:HAEPLYID family protein [Flavihumibacter sp. UBA7668]|uniref:HAEPLYID family protein n=1 Tax=Flavihumibacter sp. UBA7668 TaxID=1946542 RepID=UPI0025BEFCC4|nr:HAEPLYID family protein [Flavihumibacter sp. UBA7668]
MNKLLAQNVPDAAKNQKIISDSIYIAEIETPKQKPKVLHAEPLYVDLIRDLGARKGEKEWNIGMGITDNNRYDAYTALVEYEFAPMDRWGFEVELPFSFYYPSGSNDRTKTPDSRLNSIKLATQYTFLVSDHANTSLAIGYIHEFELISFRNYGKGAPFNGQLYNPFLVAAKRWGTNYHTLIYTGPAIHHPKDHVATTSWELHTNFHYMISGTRNFIGVEFNKNFQKNDFDMTIRPQMRVSIADNFMVGIVTGIPIRRENQRFSSFIRVIYEPGHKAIRHAYHPIP